MRQSKYTRQQMELACQALGLPADVLADRQSLMSAARAAITQKAKGVALAGVSPDPITHCTYDPAHAGDRTKIRRLIALYRLFEEAHPGVSLWPYPECERIKDESWPVVQEVRRPIAERTAAAVNIIKAHFARSASASLDSTDPLCFVFHPGLEEYVAHYVHSSPDWTREAFGDDVGNDLLSRYPPPGRLHIQPGRSYWEFA